MKNKAFLIGVNTYDLRYAERDANLMKTCLEKHRYEIIKPYKKERHSILEQFEYMLEKCGQTDNVIFYFSGHGFLERGELCLVLDETSSKFSNGIMISEIIKPFKHFIMANKLVVLDCCHSSAATDYLNSFNSLDDTTRVLTSSDRMESSKEIGEFEASFLTYQIHKALTSGVSKICINKKITIDKLYEFLVDETNEYNYENKKSLSKPIPIPNLFGNVRTFEIVTCDESVEDLEFYKVTEDALEKLVEAKKSFFPNEPTHKEISLKRDLHARQEAVKQIYQIKNNNTDILKNIIEEACEYVQLKDIMPDKKSRESFYRHIFIFLTTWLTESLKNDVSMPLDNFIEYSEHLNIRPMLFVDVLDIIGKEKLDDLRLPESSKKVVSIYLDSLVNKIKVVLQYE